MADREPPASTDAATPDPPAEGGRGSTAPAVTAAGGQSKNGAPSSIAGRARGVLTALRSRLALAIGGGAALLGATLGIVLAAGRATPAAAHVTAAAVAGTVAGAEAVIAEDAGAEATGGALADAAPEHPATWRVGQLAGSDGVTLSSGVIDRRPFLAALGSAGVSRGEAARVTRSLAEVRDVDHFGQKDAFTVARDKASGRVIAYEVTSSPVDVWQGREEARDGGSPALVAHKLGLTPELVRVHKAILVGADLRASLSDAGLGPVDEMMTMLDDALEGHAELSDVRPGARLRIVGTQEFVDGAFVRWSSLDAIEYFPASEHAPSVRVYQFADDETSKKHRGWYDAKGKQPLHGGWRLPVPLTRIASRFNPHRMHPVLHVIMPHNGVDLAAPAGAPVYATAAGTVTSVGDGGPCGNKIEIAHGHGMTSIYCHLSRFAAGLHPGEHVEQRQLIGYVGQTGRVTGPHLHFAMKRGDTFFDPLTLRLDGVRVVPRGLRDDFDRLRADLDAELDSIPLPVPAGLSPGPDVEPETFYEEPP